jgi:hypothetical protein
MPKVIEKPKYVKEKLGFSQESSVLSSCMDKVKDLVRNLVLNITGNMIQIFKSKADRRVTLVLPEEHYSVITNPDRHYLNHMDHK